MEGVVGTCSDRVRRSKGGKPPCGVTTDESRPLCCSIDSDNTETEAFCGAVDLSVVTELASVSGGDDGPSQPFAGCATEVGVGFGFGWAAGGAGGAGGVRDVTSVHK